MKIGIDAHAIGSESSGNETYYEQLLSYLVRAQTNGSQYVVYYTHPAAVGRIATNEKFVWRRIRPGTPFWRIPVGFPVEFRREKLDIFHAQLIIPPLCKCKTITTIPDIIYESHPQFFSHFETLRSKVLTRRSAKRADHIITVSEYSKNEICKTYHVDPERISVTYEGAAPEFFPRDKGACREQIARKYGVDAPFLLYVGRLQERKNLRRLLSAYAAIKKNGADERLVLVGKPDWMSGNLRSHLESLNLGRAVIFTGYVPSSDLPIFYNAAEAFLYPSILEGFGLPVVEAMACGLPVLTSYGSSLEEVAGGASMLIDPFSEESIAAGLMKLVGDPDLRSKLGGAGLARSAEFSFEKTAQQTIRIYERVGGEA